MNKIFIIGLPRTGTTSICSKCLDLGFKVAHTAYTQKTFDQAKIIADTPIFSDYQQLDKYYPNSKFILLERELTKWIPSIQQLLKRMYFNVVREDGGFNPYIKRSYQKVFSPLTEENIANDDFLRSCYDTHKSDVLRYFSKRESDLLRLDISQENSLEKLCHFLGAPEQTGNFATLNVGGKVTAWKDLVSDHKVESTKNGRISKLNYLT